MKTLLTLIITCLCITAFAQEHTIRRRNFNHTDGMAINQFDPVSYFKGTPVKGDPKIYYQYKGIEYNFASKENMEEFKKTPAKYEPAYGGWCAYSMASGKQVKSDPKTFKIINGKVYLFANFSGVNNLVKWNAAEKKSKEAADKAWAKIMNY